MKPLSEDVFVFPASFAQQRLWFLAQLVPENPFYNVPAAVRLTGRLNLATLEQAFNEILRRHEVLRTTFSMLDGQLMQVIAPSSTLTISVSDLQKVPALERESAAQRSAMITFQKPFDLTSDRLIRVTLFQLAAADQILLLTLHHIVADGWSIGVLIRELSVLYTAFLEDKPSPLKDLPIQYADFAHWQRECLPQTEAQLSYWKQQLANISTLNLPTDRPHAAPTYRGATQQQILSPTLTASLEVLSQQTEVTLFMTLLAAFQILLYQYTGQEDIAIGSPIANRKIRDIEELIGFFVNSLVLRVDLSGDLTCRELLERVKNVALAAYANQDIPFEKVVEAVQPMRSRRNPLFQVVFALQNAPIAPLNLPGLTLSPLDFDAQTTRFDLEFHCFKAEKSLCCRVVYSTDLFDDVTVDRMLQHFQIILNEIVTDPNQKISQLPTLTPEEQQILEKWNDTDTDYARSIYIHQHFEQQVLQTPDRIAVAFANRSLTYRELNQQSNQFAHYLQHLGIGSETLVGVCLDRSPEAIVAILSIWKAGAAYVPLDPDYPSDCLTFMLEDSQVRFLMTQASNCNGLKTQGIQIVDLDECWQIVTQFSQLNPCSNTTNAQLNPLAYVMYTSGSTGKPKGVLVKHQGLSNLVHAQKVFTVQPGDRVLQFASFSFDASIFEVVMALTTGATLYIVPTESRLGTSLLQFLQTNAITNVTLPPAVLATLPAANLPSLKTIISAGEVCSASVVDRWAKNHRFFNAYGLTETSIWATLAQLYPGTVNAAIGRPIPNTQTYILNSNLQRVAIGVKGELYIGGDSLAQGYLNRPELTSERFIRNPFCTETSKLLYKTGDLARHRSNGQLEFLGRADRQVKLRGIRIELGEIETVLSQYPGVRAVVVTLHHTQNQQLVAYVVATAEITGDRLREFLQRKLPHFLIPSAFVLLDALPLTPNGKVNLTALPLPTDEELNFVAPRTPVETTLVQIWTDLLHSPQIGIHDNFFALGGDSFLTVQLVEKIRHQFQQNLPLSALFLNPTIAGLASTLQAFKTSGDKSPSPLVPLQPTGTRPPFFCIHPIFGVVFPYCQLAHQLGSNQPFYGLQPQGLNAEQPAHTRIEDMAACYIQAIQAVQPQGPYFLGGWSFGGLVAFEMARQLEESGQQVALLAMLDTVAPIAQNQPSLIQSLSFLLKTAVRSTIPLLLDYRTLLGDLFKLPARRQRRTSTRRLTQRGQRPLAGISSSPFVQHLPQASRLRLVSELAIRPMLRVFYANSRAVQHYIVQNTLQKISCPITLFKTADTQKHTLNPTLGWHQLTTNDVKVYLAPGNHFSMLRQPHVQTLAEQIHNCIETYL